MRAAARSARFLEIDGPLSPQAGIERKGANLNQPRPRSLAGATILQLVPALGDDEAGRAALESARMLLQAGARAIVAGADGPLVEALRGGGGEFLPMPNGRFNPLRIRFNARWLSNLIANERIDIVHAHRAGAAWSAIAAVRRMPVFLVTSFPHQPPANTQLSSFYRASLARGERVIAPSSFVSRALIQRYGITPDRISVVPRAVDIGVFDPAAVTAARIVAMRQSWDIAPGSRVVLVPGSFAPAQGQTIAVEAAWLIGCSQNRVVFVFTGDDTAYPRHVGDLDRYIRFHGIEQHCRVIGPCADLPAALAAADVVVLPTLEPPLRAAAAVQAQAMGRPVVATNLGVLPETVLCPSRMREELRTGWLVSPGDAEELAHAIASALALDVTAYRALSARARQFAKFAFSPHSVAEATRGVYTSLLARDG